MAYNTIINEGDEDDCDYDNKLSTATTKGKEEIVMTARAVVAVIAGPATAMFQQHSPPPLLASAGPESQTRILVARHLSDQHPPGDIQN